MFVVSVKSSKVKFWLFLVFAAIVVICAVLFFCREYSTSVVAEGGISLRASNDKERIAFLSQFGWDFETEPAKVEEIVIPSEFDDVYNQYNAMQKRQSLDLEKYKGCIAKKWTYGINNYPGYENMPEKVQANLVIYKGNVIGADITVLGKDAQQYVVEFPQNKKDVNNDTKT